MKGIPFFALIKKDFEPNLGRAEFNTAILDFKKRKILQGDKTLYITPKLFHLWLWSEWWTTHGEKTLMLSSLRKNCPNPYLVGLARCSATLKTSAMLFHK